MRARHFACVMRPPPCRRSTYALACEATSCLVSCSVVPHTSRSGGKRRGDGARRGRADGSAGRLGVNRKLARVFCVNSSAGHESCPGLYAPDTTALGSTTGGCGGYRRLSGGRRLLDVLVCPWRLARQMHRDGRTGRERCHCNTGGGWRTVQLMHITSMKGRVR